MNARLPLPSIRSSINRRVINALAFTQKLGIKGSPWTDVGRGKADEWSSRLKNL